jgi:hypothetical protein
LKKGKRTVKIRKGSEKVIKEKKRGVANEQKDAWPKVFE